MLKFGTGGWRAIIGDEFIRTNIIKVAQSLAALMKIEKVDHHDFFPIKPPDGSQKCLPVTASP